jgi:hypothetical protein
MTPSEAFGLAFPDQAHWGLDTNVRICTGIHCWDQLDLNRAGWVRLLSILICFLLNIRQGQQLAHSCQETACLPFTQLTQVSRLGASDTAMSIHVLENHSFSGIVEPWITRFGFMHQNVLKCDSLWQAARICN